MSKKDKRPSSSFSNEKFVLGCLEDKHIGSVLSNEWYYLCDFLKFDWCKMLNGYLDFSFSIFSLGMTVVSVETPNFPNWGWYK